MPKKKKEAEFKYDGVSVSLREIKKHVKEDLSKDYIASKDARRILEVTSSTLQDWHKQGKLRAIKQDNVWHYSRQDLLSIVQLPPLRSGTEERHP